MALIDSELLEAHLKGEIHHLMETAKREKDVFYCPADSREFSVYRGLLLDIGLGRFNARLDAKTFLEASLEKLGISVGQYYTIEGCNILYHFDDKGILYCYNGFDAFIETELCSSNHLQGLLDGRLKIEKKLTKEIM